MGYKYSRDDILEAALLISIEEGVGRLTYGRVAKQMGIHDRTVVYYFPTKDALIQAVIEAHSVRFQSVLAEAFYRPARDRIDLLRMAWPVVASEAADPVFRVFFEVLSLGMRGISPFDRLVPPAVDAWIESLMRLLDVPAAEKRAEAEAAIALIDGLLLLRHIVGPEVADRAAQRLGNFVDHNHRKPSDS